MQQTAPKGEPAKKKRNACRQVLFYLFSFSIPFMLLACIEIMLRITHAGPDTRLFVQSERLPGYLVMNPQVSLRYFTQQKDATRGYMEEFPPEKEKNTVRIFIQGESSAIGFPYLYNGSFHRMLKYRLEQEFPDTRFEIINLGLTAICSFTMLDFGREIIKQSPDAILIYTGQNEYVGAMGVGATSHYKSNTRITRWIISIRKLRLVQSILNLMQKRTPSDDMHYDETLMQRMAEKQQIEYGSKAYYAGINQFRNNMDRLIALYHEANIPVFIADLPTNDKDLPPFLSRSSETRPNKQFPAIMQQAEKEMQEDNNDVALKQLRLAEKTDSAHAGIQYLIGRAYYNLNQWDSARIHFVMARNYDQLRFRAPEDINSAITGIAREHDACFIPVKSIFERESPGGIIGNELLTEHVHPNLTGYYLIAKAFHDSLVNSSVLKHRKYNPMDENIFRKNMPITDMDSLYGVYNIVMLKKGWPFFIKDSVVISPQDPLQTRLAKQIVLNKTNWLKAMDEIYLDALSHNDHKTGLMISEGLHLEFPYDIRFVVKAARHATSIGNNDKSAWYYAKAFSMSSSLEYARESMIAYLKADKPEKALDYIKILMSNRAGKDKYLNISLMTENIIRNKIMLSYDSLQLKPALEIAKNYYLMGNFEPAEKYSLVALTINPESYEANTLLKEIKMQKTANAK